MATWLKRLESGSSEPMSTRENIQTLHSLFDTLAEYCDYRWSKLARDTVLHHVYKAFVGQHIHLFINGVFPRGELIAAFQAKNDPNYGVDMPGMPCGHIFKKGDCCYKCRDCALDDSCVLCSRCFHASDHENHNVSFYLTVQPGGCCDCGDKEAWQKDLGCAFHSEKISYRPPKKALPSDLRNSITKTIDCVLDFILDTLDYSPEDAIPPRDENQLRGLPTESGEVPAYAVVIWNDEKHSFSEVASQLTDVIHCTEQEAKALADLADYEGRAVVEISRHAQRAFLIGIRLAQIDLGVTVRKAKDTFREQMVSVLIECIDDLTKCLVNGTDAVSVRQIIASRLFEPRNKPPGFSSVAHLPTINPSRMEWLFLYHTRLWKRPRLFLKDMYISILNLSHDHKIATAVRFATVYNRLMDSYLLVDREAETSIKYFAVQLFTVPTVAEHIVKNNAMVDRLLKLIVAFFTNQIANRRIETQPFIDRELAIDSFPFRSKRFMPVFSDLRYICANNTVQELIAHEESYITRFVRLCRLFVGMNPSKRASSSHVEYEQEGWVSVFNATLSLSRVIKVYAEAFSRATTRELCNAIKIVSSDILSTCTLAVNGLDRTKYQAIQWRELVVAGKSYDVINFDVLSGFVSFHHSQHWLLAELLKHADLLKDEALQAIGFSSLGGMLSGDFSKRSLLVLMEFPLRVLTMIAQIRTGLWVRNGFTLRGQLLHYRDYMLRDLCYDQDLFIVQASLVLAGPDPVLVSVLDRFALLEWFSGEKLHDSYEGSHLFGMIEEFLYLIITSLSECGKAKNFTIDQIVRREAIHGLALGPCSYTDLCKRVAERIVDEVAFDRALEEIATFKAPEGITDIGIFELKDEFFDEVNPFFFHYTRNRREEVEGILKARLTRKTGLKDPVVVPKPVEITSGPFKSLPSTFLSPIFLQMMVLGLFNTTVDVQPSPHSTDAILDQIIHLIMLALVEQPGSFARLATSTSFPSAGDTTLLKLLCALETSDKATNFKNKVKWCLSIFTSHVPSEVALLRQTEGPEADPKDGKSIEAKKRAAKARQAAIMKQFAAQQESFLNNIEDEDVSEDEDELMADVNNVTPSLGSCIVCQEALDQSRGFGALGFVQPSRFRRQMPPGSAHHVSEALSMGLSLDEAIPMPTPSKPSGPFDFFHAFPPDNTTFGIQTSLCGHFMHVECFKVYSLSVEQRHLQQTQRNHPENIERDEFICPLCKSLGNVLLPVHDQHTFKVLHNPPPRVSLSEWIRSAGIELLRVAQDRRVDGLLSPDGSGEFSFWTAGDITYPTMALEDEVHTMVQTLKTSVQSISEQSGHLHGRPGPSDTYTGGGLYLPEHMVAYTLTSIEVAQRGVSRSGFSIADSMSESTRHLIQASLTSLRELAALQFPDRPDSGISSIRQALIRRIMPQWTRDPMRLPLLFRDPLTLLVEVAAVAPDILPHATTLMYYACLSRTCIGLLGLLSELPAASLPPDLPDEDYSDIFGDLRTFVLSVARHSPELDRQAHQVFRSLSGRFEKLIYSFTLPFLRRAALLNRAVQISPLSEPLYTTSQSSEYSRLLDILRIPPLAELSQQEALKTVLAGWSTTYGVLHSLSLMDCSIPLDVPFPYRLAQLPHALDDLFLDSRTLLCHRCNTVPADAAVCLFCGTVCCYQMHCCTDQDQRGEGECNMHTRECGGVVGLFYCVKRCAILYLYAGSGAVGPSPYLDIHGEVDLVMRRGRRQYLHPRRLEELHKTWLNQGIPTFVARKLDAIIDAGGWDSI